MINNNIHHIISIKQATKEGNFTMKGIALINLLHSLIREYGTYKHGSLSIDPNTLSLSDKKLVLSHITDSGEYAWIMENSIRVEVSFQEYIEHIQLLLDEECSEVYREDMEDRGMIERHHSDNNEIYWARR